jgi:hypothetical protein
LERKRKVSLVTDAIQTLAADNGQKALDELSTMGARLVKAEKALGRVDESLVEEENKRQHKLKPPRIISR